MKKYYKDLGKKVKIFELRAKKGELEDTIAELEGKLRGYEPTGKE